MAIEKKFNTEAVHDYPQIRFEIRFERKFPIVGLYFLTLPVETLRNLCPVEKLFGMRMAGLCQFYWRTFLFLNWHQKIFEYFSLQFNHDVSSNQVQNKLTKQLFIN